MSEYSPPLPAADVTVLDYMNAVNRLEAFDQSQPHLRPMTISELDTAMLGVREALGVVMLARGELRPKYDAHSRVQPQHTVLWYVSTAPARPQNEPFSTHTHIGVEAIYRPFSGFLTMATFAGIDMSASPYFKLALRVTPMLPKDFRRTSANEKASLTVRSTMRTVNPAGDKPAEANGECLEFYGVTRHVIGSLVDTLQKHDPVPLETVQSIAGPPYWQGPEPGS